eukprot:CAMPEP_0195134914 /NCGR_PEP_ID=MMETSP0448-20130528/151527_1 /TAXON_ID=66468 /ORGANISM="Heterocapsa triquestra, Strain CCMP 448" /LENGTH=41 /DNA_ID= /DNA_START= /DNA_END= /DNA_ORIENTATION=
MTSSPSSGKEGPCMGPSSTVDAPVGCSSASPASSLSRSSTN